MLLLCKGYVSTSSCHEILLFSVYCELQYLSCIVMDSKQSIIMLKVLFVSFNHIFSINVLKPLLQNVNQDMWHANTTVPVFQDHSDLVYPSESVVILMQQISDSFSWQSLLSCESRAVKALSKRQLFYIDFSTVSDLKTDDFVRDFERLSLSGNFSVVQMDVLVTNTFSSKLLCSIQEPITLQNKSITFISYMKWYSN